MKIDVLTLFPEMFDGFKTESIIKRAINNEKVEINIINFRDYTPLKNGQVDDTIYGGGAGMLIRCEPIFECVKHIKTEDSFIILLTPDGKTFNQKLACDLSHKKHLIFICGHYEGFDERIRTLCDMELSIGEFVLTGGEYPSMCMMDAIIRLIPGVINKESLDNESFTNNVLDYPMYTKPYEYEGMKVPDILISGDHKKIEMWRKEMAKNKTIEKRPDIMENEK